MSERRRGPSDGKGQGIPRVWGEMRRAWGVWAGVLGLVGLQVYSGCSGDRFETCEEGPGCEWSGGGASSSEQAGAASTGGMSSGGMSGASGSGGESGGGVGGESACGGPCGGEQGRCNVERGECVECVTAGDCTRPEQPVCEASSGRCVECQEAADCVGHERGGQCDVRTQQCVECVSASDCREASASRCDEETQRCMPCVEHADCAQVAGAGVCSAGRCVECTGRAASACGAEESSGTPYVCESEQQTCTKRKAQSAGLCERCVSDAECKPGQLCVLDTVEKASGVEAVGHFCHWKKGDTAHGAPALCSEGRPYVRTHVGVTSLDGEVADICTLAVSTCPANNDFRSKSCASAMGEPDDTQCGVASPTDAKCALFDTNTFRCTMTCGSDDDCPKGFTCNVSAEPRVCAL